MDTAIYLAMIVTVFLCGLSCIVAFFTFVGALFVLGAAAVGLMVEIALVAIDDWRQYHA